MEDTMVDELRMALEGLLRKSDEDGDTDFLREGLASALVTRQRRQRVLMTPPGKLRR
jgi:hypothetical protein